MRLPALPASMQTNKRSFGVYLSGVLFAAGWWFFLDAALRSKLTGHHNDPAMPPETAIHSADWMPGICATIGLLIINLVDKQHLLDTGGAFQAGAGSWGTDPIQWRTRLWLFLGFAFLAGGMAGSIALLVVKYIVPEHSVPNEEYGVANVVQNVGIMASAVILWLSQRVESDYEYNLTL